MIKSKYTFEVIVDEKEIVLLNLITFQYEMIKGSNSEVWKSEEFEKLDRRLLDTLLNKRFLVNIDEEDEKIFQYAFKLFGIPQKDVPSHTIYVTSKCNMKCPYCFEKNLNFGEEYLNKVKVDKIIETIGINGGKKELKKILIFGGEPFLKENKEIIIYLFKRLREFKFRYVEIVTNGMEIEFYQDVIRDYADVISGIRFTLNGSEDVHNKLRDTGCYRNTYQRIIRAIKIIQKIENIRIDINVLLDQSNIDSIGIMVDDLREKEILGKKNVFLGFGRTQFAIAPGSDNYIYEIPIERYYGELVDLYKKNSKLDAEFFQGGETALINELIKNIAMGREKCLVPAMVTCRATNPGRYCYYVDGKIYPCTEVAGVKKYAIGSYYPTMEEYQAKSEWEKYKLPLKCKNCRFVAFCNGGCPVSNLSVNGDINKVYCNNIEGALSNTLLRLYKGGFLKDE